MTNTTLAMGKTTPEKLYAVLILEHNIFMCLTALGKEEVTKDLKLAKHVRDLARKYWDCVVVEVNP